jgi:hypothetical protein
MAPFGVEFRIAVRAGCKTGVNTEEISCGKTGTPLKERQPASPVLPLGGVCDSMPIGMTFGRSSDLQAAYWLQLPSLVFVHGWTRIGQVLMLERSFLLTAAGQFRICAGFPFQVRLAIHHRKQNRLYRESGSGSTAICCGICGNTTHGNWTGRPRQTCPNLRQFTQSRLWFLVGFALFSIMFYQLCARNAATPAPRILVASSSGRTSSE